MIVFFVSSCGTRESIRSKYFYSDRVKEVLTDEEYYKLDKEAKWPIHNQNDVCTNTSSEAIFDLDIKESLTKK
jgi:hypothetical protein